MGITLSQAKKASRLKLEGEIDISVAAELKAALLKAIAAGKTIRISAEAVTELDVTALQLLWAAERAAREGGTRLIFTGEMSSPVRGALLEMGVNARALSE